MKKCIVPALMVLIPAIASPALSSPLVAQVPTLRQAMETAVLPLPTALREGAGILRWSAPGRTERLRESENGMSCSVDNPDDDRLDVRCYHDDFWPVIRRARQLAQTLGSREEVYRQVHRELDAGEIQLPSAPTAGYRMLGPVSALDHESGEAGPDIAKWQSIHFPFRTAEEMGLPETRESSEPTLKGLMPFVMASGTWWSHVMIVHEPFD